MEFLPRFLLRILRANPRPGGSRVMVYILIPQPYAYLEEELRRAFQGQENVKVIVDRRYGGRRTSRQVVAAERRGADRRKPKEELAEVVIVEVPTP